MEPAVWRGGGLAMASKINTAPVALLLPLALLLRWLRLASGERGHVSWPWRLPRGGRAGAFSSFRVAQPYAFSGPGFFDL
jgi:hypothetical protein